jgi:CheY-like chemotaxis protein
MDVTEDLGLVLADARKVKQIVYNLLSNAVKFAVEGGRVTLRVSRVPRVEVGQMTGFWGSQSFPLAENEFATFLKISVIDNGIGISPEGLQHLFRPFNQIDSGLARKFEGTGLGLAMVKVLAELHGGALAAESAIDTGSCFTVWLPLRAPEGSLPAPAGPPGVGALARAGAVLVVEDDFQSADLIRVQLEAEGFEVLHAATAEEARLLAGRQPLSLITLDIMLPNMDGWEFLSRIKQVPALSHIPVVIISIVPDRKNGFSLGAAGVMQKPIARLELHRAPVELGLCPPSPAQTLKVLIVDDDPKAVELVSVHLVGLAGTVLCAHGGLEAIDVARRELPNVIVLDLMMQEVNGFEVMEALQKRTETAQIPIVVVTAKHPPTEELVRLNGFVTTVMDKGEFDRDRFTAEIRRATSNRSLGA